MERVTEGSTCWLTVAFFDRDSVAATPDSATWEVYDTESGSTLQAATAITGLSTTVTLTVSPTLNTLQGVNDEEERRVVVRASFGASDACVARYKYLVVRAD